MPLRPTQQPRGTRNAARSLKVQDSPVSNTEAQTSAEMLTITASLAFGPSWTINQIKKKKNHKKDIIANDTATKNPTLLLLLKFAFTFRTYA